MWMHDFYQKYIDRGIKNQRERTDEKFDDVNKRMQKDYERIKKLEEGQKYLLEIDSQRILDKKIEEALRKMQDETKKKEA